jgi:hypothetical protein
MTLNYEKGFPKVWNQERSTLDSFYKMITVYSKQSRKWL